MLTPIEAASDPIVIAAPVTKVTEAIDAIAQQNHSSIIWNETRTEGFTVKSSAEGTVTFRFKLSQPLPNQTQLLVEFQLEDYINYLFTNDFIQAQMKIAADQLAADVNYLVCQRGIDAPELS